MGSRARPCGYLQCLTPGRVGVFRATLQRINDPPLLRFAGLNVRAGDLRAYATLLWVGKAAIIGYVTVSITQRGGAGGVRHMTTASLLTAVGGV